MKKINLDLIENENNLKYYENESFFMKQFDHINVCKLYTSFKEGNNLYMIMEYIDNGDLDSLLLTNIHLKEKIKEEKLWDIFGQCLKGLSYIHSLGIIHRDIKPQNIFLNKEGEVKIGDFNMSSIEEDKIENFSENEEIKDKIVNRMTEVGSKGFMAPEILNDNNYNNKVDVYSMGITFCILAFNNSKIPPNATQIYSKELVKIIKLMIRRDQELRPNSLKIYKTFINYYVEKNLYNTSFISCINCLSVYKSLRDYFLEKKDTIDPLNKISLYINKFIRLLERKKKHFGYKKFSINLEKLEFNQILYDSKELLNEYELKNCENNNKENNPVFLIKFILKKLHEELNKKKFKDKNYYSQEYDKGDNPKKEAYENYTNFSRNNFQSIISDNFFGLMKKTNLYTM